MSATAARRRGLGALGTAAAALVAGACATVALGLDGSFERAAQRSDLADVLVRVDPERERDVERRLRALPGLEARSYRFEVNQLRLRAGTNRSDRGVAHTVLGGRRGYAIVEGSDLRADRDDVLVEQGLARAWDLRPGDRIDVQDLGSIRVAGTVLSPDNVAFPLASAPRIYLGRDEITRRFGPGEFPVNLAQVWLRPGADPDVALAQARSQAFGVTGLAFVTRAGVEVLVGEAAGVVVALLTAFALVALLAAAVMLATAAQADVQRRLEGIAVRRALGSTRRRLAGEEAARAALLALPAAAAGLAVGWLAARGPTDDLVALLNGAPATAGEAMPVLAALLGAIVLVVAVSAAWPSWRATASSPAALLRGGELARGRRRRGRDAGSAPSAVVGDERAHAPAPGGAVPAAARTRAGAVGARPALLGARLVAARRSRLLSTVAVVAACTAIVLLLLSLASLLTRLRDDPATLGKRYQLAAQASNAQFPAVRAIPGVEDVGERVAVDAADAFRLGESLKLFAWRGDHTRFEAPPLAEGRRLRGAREAEIGRGLADSLGLAPGGTLATQVPGGREVRFRVVGVVRALENDGRVAYVRPDRLGAAALDSGRRTVAVKVEPGADRQVVARRLAEAGFAASRVGGATGRSGTLLAVLAAVLRVVALTVALVCLYALVQALATVASERRATLGLLRALGAGRGTLLRVLGGAAAAVVLPAAVLAVLLERLVLGPLVARRAAGYADLALGASAGQALLAAAGLAVLAALAAALVAARAARASIPSLVRSG